MTESSRHLLGVEDYLQMEERATVRHEYVGGELYALAGASDRHNRIAGNIFAALWNAAKGGSCRVYMSDMKLRVSDDVFYYPDVMVVCKPLQPGNPSFQTEPCVVVEVTSSSTEAVDRREKLQAYTGLESLSEYVIVSQDRRWVERRVRDEAGVWQRGDLVNEGGFGLPCPEGAELSLDDIYAGIELPD